MTRETVYTLDEKCVDVISIPMSEYESLLEDSKFLQALQAAGVDSWDGYDYAIEIFNE